MLTAAPLVAFLADQQFDPQGSVCISVQQELKNCEDTTKIMGNGWLAEGTWKRVCLDAANLW
jgi:hypothetical protein